MNELSAIFKEIRKIAGLSPTDVAKGIDINLHTYIDLEANCIRLNWTTYKRIANFWKIPYYDLLKFRLTLEQEYDFEHRNYDDPENYDLFAEVFAMYDFIAKLANSEGQGKEFLR